MLATDALCRRTKKGLRIVRRAVCEPRDSPSIALSDRVLVWMTMAFWEDTLRYLYLPRLKNRDVLAHAIQSGAKSCDFFGTAYGQSGEKFDGFQFGHASVQFDDTLLLIKPEAAKRYEESQSKPGEPRKNPPVMTKLLNLHLLKIPSRGRGLSTVWRRLHQRPPKCV
jgi:hypothetical protein